jgi:hypothetical protein
MFFCSIDSAMYVNLNIHIDTHRYCGNNTHVSGQTHICTRVQIARVHDTHIYSHADSMYIVKSRMSNLVSQVMEKWFSAHRDNPYPSEEEKRVLLSQLYLRA